MQLETSLPIWLSTGVAVLLHNAKININCMEGWLKCNLRDTILPQIYCYMSWHMSPHLLLFAPCIFVYHNQANYFNGKAIHIACTGALLYYDLYIFYQYILNWIESKHQLLIRTQTCSDSHFLSCHALITETEFKI